MRSRPGLLRPRPRQVLQPHLPPSRPRAPQAIRPLGVPARPVRGRRRHRVPRQMLQSRGPLAPGLPTALAPQAGLLADLLAVLPAAFQAVRRALPRAPSLPPPIRLPVRPPQVPRLERPRPVLRRLRSRRLPPVPRRLPAEAAPRGPARVPGRPVRPAFPIRQRRKSAAASAPSAF